jgi:hypothetical protein
VKDTYSFHVANPFLNRCIKRAIKDYVGVLSTTSATSPQHPVPVSGYVVLAFKGKKMQKSINFIFVKGMQMTADFAFLQ